MNPIVSMNWLTVMPFNTCTFLKTSSAITGCCAAAVCAKPTRAPSAAIMSIAAASTTLRLPNFIAVAPFSPVPSSGCFTARQSADNNMAPASVKPMFTTQFAETKTLAGQHSNSFLPCTAAIGSGGPHSA
jgi:hypothetical protein